MKNDLREEYLQERREFQARGRLAKYRNDEWFIMDTIVKILCFIVAALVLYALYITFM